MVRSLLFHFPDGAFHSLFQLLEGRFRPFPKILPRFSAAPLQFLQLFPSGFLPGVQFFDLVPVLDTRLRTELVRLLPDLFDFLAPLLKGVFDLLLVKFPGSRAGLLVRNDPDQSDRFPLSPVVAASLMEMTFRIPRAARKSLISLSSSSSSCRV